MIEQRLKELEDMYDRLADNPSWVHPDTSQSAFSWLLKEIMDLREARDNGQILARVS